LSLDNIGKISTITITLKLIQQVQFMLFEFLNSSVQTRDGFKHFIMLCLILGNLIRSIFKLYKQLFYFFVLIDVLLLLFIQVTLDTTKSSLSQLSQSFFSLFIIL
jgi:hypothetical protein